MITLLNQLFNIKIIEKYQKKSLLRLYFLEVIICNSIKFYIILVFYYKKNLRVI